MRSGQLHQDKAAPDARKRAERVDVDAASPVRSRLLLVVAALLVAMAGVYEPVANYEFVSWDDPQYIVANPNVARGLTWNSVGWAFTTGYAASWHPLTWLSFMADVTLFGTGAGPHRVVNVVLHILNAVLVLAVLVRTTGALWQSAFVAALFALHPLRVESVAWITERKDVLSSFFMWLSILVYVDFVARRRWSMYTVSLCLFACGLLSKSMVVTLPFVLLLLDVWPLRRVRPGIENDLAWRHLVGEKLPFVALAIASGVATVRAAAGTVAALDVLPVRYRVANAIVSYLVYVREMVWPAGLAAFYPYRPYPTWAVLTAASTLVAVTALAIRQRRVRPYLAVGWLWYVVTLLPVIGLLQAGGQSHADRFTYVPLTGLFVAIAWGAPELLGGWRRSGPVLGLAAAVVLAACGVCSAVQVTYWKNSRTLWARALAVTTDNYRAHNHYGVAVSDEGRAEEAIAHYEEALRIWPDFPEAHVNLGVALAEKGRLDDAIGHYRRALAVKPGLVDARNDLASALAEQGHTEAAIEQLREAARLAPGDPTIEYNLGVLYESAGLRKEAVRHLNAALAADPAVKAWERRLIDAERRVQTERVLFDRELFYAIQPRERLEAMINRYNSALK